MKTPWFKSLALILTVATLAAACQPESSKRQGDGTANPEGSLTDENWSDPQVDSENLTDDAESTLAIDTLDAALVKLNEALKLNPANARADVWVSFIKLELELKGILARVRPFIESMPNGEYEYQKMLDSQSSDQDLLRRFYLDGPNDIRTADDFQEWVDRIDLRLTELRETLARHKGEEIRLLVPNNAFATFQQGASRKKNDCSGKEWGPIKYQPSDCSQSASEFRLNRTDMEAVSTLLSSYQAAIAVMNAYRLSQDVINKIRTEAYYADGTAFGILVRDGAQLRTKQNIKVVGDNFRDFALAARYIIEHQKEACPKGRESVSNRKGYLFGYGICIGTVLSGTNSLERTNAMINQVLNRLPITIQTNGASLPLEVDVNRFLQTPIPNLHDFDPLSQSACGTYQPNLTPLKAYVVKGDLEKALEQAGVMCGERQYRKRFGL